MIFYNERKQVLNTAREIFAAKLVSGTWGNVSLRISENLIAITPSGMDYNTLDHGDMVIVDGDQKVVDGLLKPSIETPLHLGIYKNRPEINAIVHVHSPYATTFAVAGQSIPVILEETAQTIGHEIKVAPYAHCGTDELVDNVLRTLGSQQMAVLLANHGLVGLGETASAALKVCYVAEKTAMVSIMARTLGSVNVLLPEDVEYLHREFKYYSQGQKK